MSFKQFVISFTIGIQIVGWWELGLKWIKSMYYGHFCLVEILSMDLEDLSRLHNCLSLHHKDSKCFEVHGHFLEFIVYLLIGFPPSIHKILQGFPLRLQLFSYGVKSREQLSNGVIFRLRPLLEYRLRCACITMSIKWLCSIVGTWNNVQP